MAFKPEKTTVSSTSKAEATPEEKALLQQQIEMNQFMAPFAKQNYADLSKNIQAILEGNQPMAKGIGGVSAEDTTNMANAAVRSVLPQFQSAGILDSGIAVQGATRAAADVMNQNAQFNTSAAQNLFNLASGGQSNLQGQQQSNTNSLVGQLAGLRQTNSNQTTMGMNPFLKSFEQSAGQSLGKTTTGGRAMSFGGFSIGGTA